MSCELTVVAGRLAYNISESVSPQHAVNPDFGVNYRIADRNCFGALRRIGLFNKPIRGNAPKQFPPAIL